MKYKIGDLISYKSWEYRRYGKIINISIPDTMHKLWARWSDTIEEAKRGCGDYSFIFAERVTNDIRIEKDITNWKEKIQKGG